MSRKPKTKKDIIKNIAIIFLSVMLALTFFSNTILNWSLPQVSGKYTEYGEIKTGVRGSGTVISNMTYTHTIKGMRTVKEVYVNRGSQVEAGQVLMLLSPLESENIDALRAEIESLQNAYDRTLLSREENDYTSDEIAIRNAEEDLNEIKAERAVYTDEYIAQIKKEHQEKKDALEKAESEIELLEERLSSLSNNSQEPEIVAARESVKLAENALEEAKKALSKYTYIDTDSLSSSRDALYDQLDSLIKQRNYLKEDYAEEFAIYDDYTAKKRELEKAVKKYDDALAEYNKVVANPPAGFVPEQSEEYAALTEAETAKHTAQTAYDTAEQTYQNNAEDIKTALRALDAKEAEIDTLEGEIGAIRNQITNASQNNRHYKNYSDTVEIKENALEEAEKKLESLVEKYNKDKADKLKTAKKELEAITEAKAEADKKLAELDGIDDLDDRIKSGERSLESMKLSLEQRKENDKRAQQLEDFDLNKQYREIQDKKAELAQLEGKSDEGYELRASHAGRVTEVNFKPGETAADGAAAVVVEVVESGYTLSFSVSNTEAQKVKVGDTATVSDTYWGQQVGATLKSIVPNSDGKTRTLTFDLSGNPEVSQTLTLLVGERSTGYSAVIPKSALHEDAKGKFIYVTKTKSTPLGDRYIATRLDVSVAATDDKNVAITTDETYLYEYVITSSTKPFEEGGYVRLSD